MSDDKIKCKKCGNMNRNGLKFCTECGALLELTDDTSQTQNTTREQDNMNICPKCKGKIRSGLRFCTKCGYSLTGIDDALLDENTPTEIDSLSVEEDNNNESQLTEMTACPKCGTQNDVQLNFCRKCGTRLNDTSDTSDVLSPKRKKRHVVIWIIVILLILLLLGGGAFAYLYYNDSDLLTGLTAVTKSVESNVEDVKENNKKKEDEQTEDLSKGAEEDKAAEEPVVDTEEEQNSVDEEPLDIPADTDNSTNQEDEVREALLEEFRIDPDTVEDYSQNLNPKEYIYYSSDIGEYSFFYPAGLFCNVKVDDNNDQRDFGEHIKTVTFYGSKGSELSYSVYKRTDGRTLDDAVNNVHSYEQSMYFETADILVSSKGDNGGRIVMTGLMDENGEFRIYDLIKISDEYLYQMKSIKPHYNNDDEEKQYAYVTENEYRMCGFSGSTKKARSFEEFLEDSN